MKLVKTASGKTIVKISRSEWESYGRKAGWLEKKATSIQQKLGACISAADSTNAQKLKDTNERKVWHTFYTKDDMIQLVCSIPIYERIDLNTISGEMNEAKEKLIKDGASLGTPRDLQADIHLIDPGRMSKAYKVLRITLVVEGTGENSRAQASELGYIQYGWGQFV